MNKKLIYGADPEFAAAYKKDGELYILPPVFFRTELGVKSKYDPKHPKFVIDKELGIVWHEDGTAFELSIRPSDNWRDLFFGIQEAKRIINEKIISQFPEHCLPELQSVPTIGFEVERWKKKDDDYRMCMIFGCDEDFNALNMKKKNKVVDALEHPWRYLGGHLHFSGNVEFFLQPENAIKNLIVTAGLAGVAYSKYPELDRKRTYLYGQPDKFRSQEYELGEPKDNTVGIEYRTLSVSWTDSIVAAEHVFEWATIGLTDLFNSGKGLEIFSKIGKEACDAIMQCDSESAKSMLDYVETQV